ncbi:flagellar hook-associated protein FlgK [Deltaproteobacteria bacterium Smac51]|nr:flagellar hook-associated protein FlgK [Deltaproteobacteria bacterium Smac51]
MGISSSLYVAISGMNMSMAGMEVASHNIANVNTPGYSRQRLNLETSPTWKAGSQGQMGTGVSAQNISRFHDEFLTRSIIQKSTEYGAAVAKKNAIDNLEAFFNESSGNGVNAAMNDFFAIWDSVADGSDLPPTRKEMIAVAETLAQQVATRRADMDAVRQDLNARVESAVTDINSILHGIADLNQQIMTYEDIGRNQQLNDMRDARDALMIQLGELISIEHWEDPTNGAVNITLASGPGLLMNTTVYEMGTAMDDSGDLRIIANNRRTSPPWPEDVTERLEGGAVGGWVEFRDETMREFYLQYESFVDNLIFQINNQHAQGSGLDLYTNNTASNLVSNHPSQTFEFGGTNNDIKITANTVHLDSKEPYDPMRDPENIAIRFVKSDKPTNEITSSVVWNNGADSKNWEITIVLPTDSNGNVTATAEDVIRHINTEKTATPTSGVATLPPQSTSWPYKVGDFINAQSGNGENWTGQLNFSGKSFPTGDKEFTNLDRTLANSTNMGHHLSYGSEYASLTTSQKHTNNDLVFTASKDYKGAAGEKIAIEYLAPSGPNQALGVTVGNDIDGTIRISVQLGSDENGKINTKAVHIKDLLNSDQATKNLIEVTTAEGQDGSGEVEPMDKSFLDRSGAFEIVTYSGEPPEPTINRIVVDPTDTLNDIVKRIGTNFDDGVKGIRAEVLTDKHGQQTLRIIADSESGVEYGFRNDTSGALAVLGINNLFTGDSSSNIGVNQQLVENPNLLGAGKISSDGARAKDGDNTNALDMSDLKDKRFEFYGVSSATLGTAFNTFYSGIGATNRTITTNHDFTYGVLTELNDRQDALAGVNLDEELSDVLRYQYMYQASAKMITTIDEMLSTLLAIR